ncbi:transmembrane protein 130 [Latimeria chalumnae]|uniref:transmembrane protein 130 n=1 Tax=Latimeria chalumnae TaxID=7897 RepID=UPI00313DADFF
MEFKKLPSQYLSKQKPSRIKAMIGQLYTHNTAVVSMLHLRMCPKELSQGSQLYTVTEQRQGSLNLGNAALYYTLEVKNNGPITTGAQATITASLSITNGSVVFPADPKLYHFHWTYTYLKLTKKSDEEFNSSITVHSEVSGNYSISVWANKTIWNKFPEEATEATTISGFKRQFDIFLEKEGVERYGSVVGHLLIAQPVNSSTILRHGPELSTDTLTTVSFILYDPSNYFSSASFTYSWDFGDGKRILTNESSVYHNYSSPEKCRLQVEVLAEVEHNRNSKHGNKKVQKKGFYSASLNLLAGAAYSYDKHENVASQAHYTTEAAGDNRMESYVANGEKNDSYPIVSDAVTSIEVKGPTSIKTQQTLTLAIAVNGSPPLTLCWLIVAFEWTSGETEKCHQVVLNETHYNLSYSFNASGKYFLSVNAKNDISMLQAYHDITVWQNNTNPLLFILPCTLFILVLLAFIIFTTFRTSMHHKDLVEVADFDFSPTTEKGTLQPADTRTNPVMVCCSFCIGHQNQESFENVGETQPLLQPSYRSKAKYNV